MKYNEIMPSSARGSTVAPSPEATPPLPAALAAVLGRGKASEAAGTTVAQEPSMAGVEPPVLVERSDVFGRYEVHGSQWVAENQDG